MTPLRVMLAMIAAFGPVARAADAAVLCRTATRAVVERTACRAREMAIPLVEVGPAGPAGPSGPAGARGRGTVSIVDAAGTVVGPVVHIRKTPAAPSSLGSPAAFALVEHQAVGGLAALGILFAGQAAGTVYYPDDACMGTAFVPAAEFLPALQVVQDTVFVPITPAPLTSIRAFETVDRSYPCVTTTPRGGCCVAHVHTFAAGVLAVAGNTTLDALGLRAPFSARVE